MPAPHPLSPWRDEFAATLRLAGPLAAANLLQMLTYAIDVMFIARLGEEELAASALAVSIYWVLGWSLTGLAGALAAVASAELGARAPALRPIRRCVRMALWLAVIAGAGAMAVCALTEPIMLATGQSPRLATLAGDYMAVLLWSMIPMIAAGVLRSFVSTLGRPIFAAIITAAGIGVNALGNYALIFGNLGAPALGLEGAAWATVLTSLAVLGAYVLAIRLDPRLHRYRVFGFFWRADVARLRELLRIGTPIALTIVAEAGVFSAAALLMGRLGALPLAAHTLALQIASFAFQVPFGIGQAATIRVGLHFGAGDPKGVARAGQTALVLATGFMMTTAAAMLLVPRWLLAPYVETEAPANAALVALTVQFLAVAAAFQLSDGVQVVAAGALRGLQDTRVPMWIALFSYWVVGFVLAAGLGLGTPLAGLGVWLGLAAGLTCTAALMLRRWHRRAPLGLLAADPLRGLAASPG
ncbi:MAG: MATE family efflux transporter [Porphyrobacter sp.]|nr:MATE family efflux transporter [Porphyrobacter sp.]